MVSITKGNSEFVILFVIIVIAFLLSGGQFLIPGFDGKNGEANSSNEASPSAGTTGGESPANGNGGNPLNSPGWNVSVLSNICNASNKNSDVTFALEGNAKGYYAVAVSKNGGFSTIYTHPFSTPPLQDELLHLGPGSGVATSKWKVTLSEGGTQSGETWSGGTQKASLDMESTGCN